MAKRNNEATFGSDRAKVRVLIAELEGNNESVQEAVRAMVSAMSRPARGISEHTVNGETPLLPKQPVTEEIEEAIDHPNGANALSEEVTRPNERRPRGPGKKVDRNAGLSLVPDLNFRPEGKPTLKDFVQEKRPRTDIQAVLLIVYYLQHFTDLAKIGPSHVMTALKGAGKTIPIDLRATIRNAKNSRVWLNFTDTEDIRTTTQGDDFVEHDMAKGD